MSEVPETIPELSNLLPKAVNVKKTGDVNDILPDMCTVLKGILAQLTKLTSERDHLDDKVIDLERKVDDLKIEVMDMKMKECKNRVRIGGLPAGKNETTKDMTVVFGELLNDIGIEEDDECDFSEIYRIPMRKIPGKKLLPPVMVVTFKNFENKKMFFKCLKNLQDTKNKKKYNIFVDDDYPKELVPVVKSLQIEAKKQRSNDLRTQIRYESGTVFLYTKGKGDWSEDEWKKMEKAESTEKAPKKD